MKLDLLITGTNVRSVAHITERAVASGYNGVAITDSGHSALAGCLTASLTAKGTHISSSVAAAFSMSPMLAAQFAWELNELTAGRFRLGLGTQVRAHVRRRFSAEYDPPGPRMRDYLKSLKAIFGGFRDEGLDYEGNYYHFNLLPDEWSPGPSQFGDPAIDVAAVNPWMLRMAATYADGIHVHPLNTRAYLYQTLIPNIEMGATASGRTYEDVHKTVQFFGAGGDATARSASREFARRLVAFYGTTPNYSLFFNQIGFHGMTERLRAYHRKANADGMASLITDEVLGHFIVEGDWDELPDALFDRYGDLADRLVLYAPPNLHEEDPETFENWGQVGTRLSKLKSGGRFGI